MINVPIEKILFIDIETVGYTPTYSTLLATNGKLSTLFQKYESWFKKRFPEDEKLSLDELFVSRAADRKSTRLNSSHVSESRMPSSA